jgi:8-oxo-dGTP pyrophosphatase MutT (NUDIX family)
MADTDARPKAWSGTVMTPAEVRARVAGLLTLCAGLVDGTEDPGEVPERALSVAQDLTTLSYTVDLRRGPEAIARAVAEEYGTRITVLLDAFMNAFVDLGTAHEARAGDGPSVMEVVRRLALEWAGAAAGPECPPQRHEPG